MKNLLCVLLFIFTFCFSAFSQTEENPNCPVLSVSGPAGIVSPGEIMTFTATLDEKAKNYNIEYVWSVSEGNEIVGGQGTPKIEIIQKDAGGNTTATVEIKGLPEGCPNLASENVSYCSPISFTLIDDFSLDARRIDKARIDNLLNELQNNPNDQGYIIEYFEPKTSKASIDQKIKKLTNYIARIRRFDANRITIVRVLENENRTKFYLVPPGAEPPTPE